MGSFKRAGNRSMPETECERVREQWEQVFCWFQNWWSLGRWLVNYIRGHTRGTTLGTGGVQESRVSILWNCGLWAHHVVFFNRSSDIFHGHDSKACQRVPSQLCRQQHQYQGEGQGEPFSCSLKRGGPVGKVLVHRRLPKCHQQK